MTSTTQQGSKKMGLLPLEFADCLVDSPYFRENLRAHEKQLDQTSTDIKGIIKDVQDVVDAARTLSKAKRTLAASLSNFQFDCLGTSLTDDEIIIANSLREFSKFLSLVEDEMDRMLEHAHDKFISPLVKFRKEQIGSVRKTKKDFDKATARFCAAQDRYISLKKEDSLAEAADSARYEQRSLHKASLEYVHLMHVVQERKKFEFVETLMSFMHTWSNYYKHGYSVARDSSHYMDDLMSRVQKTRESFSATEKSYSSLKDKMLTTHQDPGVFDPMYTRQGYLYLQNKKNMMISVGSQWTKHYCQYQAKTKTLTMIPYTQMNGKITTTETVKVTSCVCKEGEQSEKFRFVVNGDDHTQGTAVTYTLQAMSEYERKHWVESLGGTWPAVNTLQRIRADSVEDNLNSVAFTFLKDCLAELESRGLTDQGLYRVGGVVSKVKKMLNQGLDPNPGDAPIDLSDPKQWESKTIASAVKQYFRDLSKPLMTHTLYHNFVEAVKHESDAQRLHELQAVMQKLPIASREMLKVLIRHLSKVAGKADKNLMTPGNLGVCFGPTLLRPREESVATIMDIKFCNEVVEILIENCDTFFPVHSDSSPEVLSARKHKGLAPPVPDSKRGERGSSTPKRTHSFSSISHLSTNSLPDIKEFNPPMLSIANYKPQHTNTDRPRSKSHQHDMAMAAVTPTTAAKHGVLSTLPPPAKLLSKSTNTANEDLMASLEMMNSLVAELQPTGNSSLKRSYTVQARRITRQNGVDQEVGTRKPPLPKLSLVCPPTLSFSPSSPVTPSHLHSSDTSSSTSSCSSVHNGSTSTSRSTSHMQHPPQPYSRMNSAPTVYTSSPNINAYPLSPRPNRPTELFVRQINLTSDHQHHSSPRSEEPPRSPSSSQVPPPIPTRRFRRICLPSGIIQPANGHNTTDSGEDHNNSARRLSESSHHRNGSGAYSGDSGVLTSPSPPTDSGIAVSPPMPVKQMQVKCETADKETNVSHSDDTVSICSSALSVESDTSGSRYDNVPYFRQDSNNSRRHSNDTTSSSKTSTLVAAAAAIAAARHSTSPTACAATQTIIHQSKGEDGDDEDEASDTSSDILVLDSSGESEASGGDKPSNNKHHYDDDDNNEEEDEVDLGSNPDEIEISDHFCRRGNSRRKFRDSGPYENYVPPPSVSDSLETPVSSSPSPASSPRQDVKLKSAAAADLASDVVTAATRLEPSSIKRLLTAGQTSNV